MTVYKPSTDYGAEYCGCGNRLSASRVSDGIVECPTCEERRTDPANPTNILARLDAIEERLALLDDVEIEIDVSDEPTQLEVANELLRAALDLMTKSEETGFMLSVCGCHTKANGGGDGYTVMREIGEYFDSYAVPREPQFPEDEAQ